MGYCVSVAVPVRTYHLRDKMVSMLNREYRTWPELHGGTRDDPTYVTPPRKHDLQNLCGRCYIGCDYAATAGERFYLYALISWIAIKIGRRTPITKTPYFIYDGHQAFGVVVDCDHIPRRCVVSDRWGVPIETKDSRKLNVFNCSNSGIWDVRFELTHIKWEPNALDEIRTEMQRLDAIWEIESCPDSF